MTTTAEHTSTSTPLAAAFASAAGDADLAPVLSARGLSLEFADPAADTAVALGTVADGGRPTFCFELSAATAHELLLGRLSIPRATVEGRLRVLGPVTGLSALADVLPVLGRHYAVAAGLVAAPST